jgi:hypothetical protein
MIGDSLCVKVMLSTKQRLSDECQMPGQMMSDLQSDAITCKCQQVDETINSRQGDFHLQSNESKSVVKSG